MDSAALRTVWRDSAARAKHHDGSVSLALPTTEPDPITTIVVLDFAGASVVAP